MNYFAIPGFKSNTIGMYIGSSITHIALIVSQKTGIPISDMVSKKRFQAIVTARQIAIYLAKKHTHQSLSSIAGFFGGRDHTTAIHSITRVKDLMETENEFADLVATIENSVLTMKINDLKKEMVDS